MSASNTEQMDPLNFVKQKQISVYIHIQEDTNSHSYVGKTEVYYTPYLYLWYYLVESAKTGLLGKHDVAGFTFCVTLNYSFIYFSLNSSQCRFKTNKNAMKVDVTYFQSSLT